MNSNQFDDALLAKKQEEEDSRPMQALDLSCEPHTVVVVSLRLSDGRRLSIERACISTWLFILENRKRHDIMARSWFDSMFDGVEYYMSRLNESDSNKLWRWFLKNGRDT